MIAHEVLLLGWLIQHSVLIGFFATYFAVRGWAAKNLG